MTILKNRIFSILLAVLLTIIFIMSAGSVCAAETTLAATEGVTSAAADADETFVYANSFECRVERDGQDDCIYIVKYVGVGGDVSVPQTIEGLPVMAVSAEAFWYNTDVTAVNLPAGLAWIDAKAFQGCKNLEYVNVPDSVLEIGDAAFEGCEKLTDINIPDELLYIGGGAFDRTAFLSEYEGMTSIIFEDKYFYRYNGNAEIVNIADGITSISSSAFAGNPYVTYVNIPESVQFIGGFSFYNCPNLKSLSVPDNLVFVGDFAFGVDSLDKSGNPVYTEGFTLYANNGTYAATEYANRPNVSLNIKEKKYNATPDELPEAEKSDENSTNPQDGYEITPGETKTENWIPFVVIIGISVVAVGGLYAYFTIKEKKEKAKKKAEKKNGNKKK